jgi:transposase
LTVAQNRVTEWFWSQTMQATVARSLVEATRTETDLAALVWDRAPRHRDDAVRALDFPLVEQPAYAPELNPAERVFEHLRAEIEGVIYPTIEAKVAAVETLLEELDADPARVQSLTNWHWIADILDQLPEDLILFLGSRGGNMWSRSRGCSGGDSHYVIRRIDTSFEDVR